MWVAATKIMDEKKIFPNHHTIRLPGYDYSQEGSYFITIVCHNRRCLFGNVTNKKMYLNNAGGLINECWKNIPELFSGTGLGNYVIMPNHIHAILNIDDRVCRDESRPPTRGGPTSRNEMVVSEASVPVNHNFIPLGEIIGAFKSLTTNEYIKHVKSDNWPRFNRYLWQDDYFEHIIRDEESLYKIQYYINTNPEEWEHDNENPYRTNVLKSN